MNLQCDECGKHFEMKPKKKTHGVSIIETYFKCPHCKKHYTSYVTNQEARRMQRIIRELTEKIGKEKDVLTSQALFVEVTDLKLELRKLMELLKRRLETK